MIYITGDRDYQVTGPTAVTLGKFDGLHRGHQKLFEKVNELKCENCCSVVFTFTIPPSLLLTGTPIKKINTNIERRHFMERFGVDYLIEHSFTDGMSRMTPREFAEQILVKQIHAANVVVGDDFHFGYKRSGNVTVLTELGKELGFQVLTMEKERYNGREISSSYVREALFIGDIELANHLLGYPYTIFGTVLHGHEIGRTLGLPTINLIPDQDKLLPPNGVYVSKTKVGDKYYAGITNIGKKPTVGPNEPVGVETYLFDWEGDLYGAEVEVMLFHYKRPEQQFESLESLKNQIRRDVTFGREFTFPS